MLFLCLVKCFFWHCCRWSTVNTQIYFQRKFWMKMYQNCRSQTRKLYKRYNICMSCVNTYMLLMCQVQHCPSHFPKDCVQWLFHQMLSVYVCSIVPFASKWNRTRYNWLQCRLRNYSSKTNVSCSLQKRLVLPWTSRCHRRSLLPCL